MLRVTWVSGVLILAAFALACGSAGTQPAGPDASGESDSPPGKSAAERWESHVAGERAKRKAELTEELKKADEEVAAAEKEEKRAKGGPKSKYDAAKDAATKAAGRRYEVKDKIDKLEKWEPSYNPTNMPYSAPVKLNAVFKVIQVVGPDAAILAFGKEWYWVEMDTTGLVDGRQVTLPGYVERAGTKQYTTAIGATKTVEALKVH